MEIVNIRTQTISCQKKKKKVSTIRPRSGDVCFQSSISLHLVAKAKTLPKLNIIQAEILLKPPSRMVPILFDRKNNKLPLINTTEKQNIIISDKKYENAAK